MAGIDLDLLSGQMARHALWTGDEVTDFNDKMLFDPEKIKAELRDRVFFGNQQMMDDHAHWVLTDEVLREFFDDYLNGFRDEQQLLEPRPRGQRKYNIIVYGVSGYTGELTLEYIANNVPPGSIRLAVAGRTVSKVEAMKRKVFDKYPGTFDPDVLQCSLDDGISMRRMCLQADCVVNIAGPFMLTGGEMLVQACLQFGTDYVDVNGEVPYTESLLKYHDAAVEAGTFIVPNAAFAGGGCDVGAWFACNELYKKYGEPCRTLRGYISASGASAPSGGTLATREAMASNMGKVASIMGNPFALGGKVGGWKDPVRPEDMDKELQMIKKDQFVQTWVGPFMYSFFETRVVRRSNHLQFMHSGKAYGPEFNFQEWASFPDEETARLAQKASTSSKQQEEELKKAGKLYKSGEGPTSDDREGAWTELLFVAKTASNKFIKAKVSAGDAYEETGHMAIEVALCCVKHRDQLKWRGGVLTPSICGQQTLVDSLNKTNLKVEVVDDKEHPRGKTIKIDPFTGKAVQI